MTYIRDLSIVTPTLNSGETIEMTLSSIAPLKKNGAEHIVVDSGSTDTTVEIARMSGSTVIFHPPGNMYSAINAGFAHSRGRFLTYINGDDILFPDYIQDALYILYSGADLVYGDIDYIDSFGRFLFHRRAPNPRNVAWLMKYYSCIPQQGALFTRTLFEKVGGFDDSLRYVADRDFFARCLSSRAKLHKISGKSAGAFRLSAKQLSQSQAIAMHHEGVVSRKAFAVAHNSQPTQVGRYVSHLFRWTTNIDGIFMKFLRGRSQDAGLRVRDKK